MDQLQMALETLPKEDVLDCLMWYRRNTCKSPTYAEYLAWYTMPHMAISASDCRKEPGK